MINRPRNAVRCNGLSWTESQTWSAFHFLISVFISVLVVDVLLSAPLFAADGELQDQASGSTARGLQGYYLHAADDAGSTFLEHTIDHLPQWREDTAYAALVSSSGSFIDGITLDVNWADVEFAPGTTNGHNIACPSRPSNDSNCFDFSYFDSELKELLALNQKYHRAYHAILAVVPSTFPNQPAWQQSGAQLPLWLFNQAGALQFHTVTSDYGMANGCLPITVPVPWDPIFLSEYAKLINAFGAFVRNEPPDIRRLISAIKLIPLPYIDEYTRLPNWTPTPDRPRCKNVHPPSGMYKASDFPEVEIPDDIENWHTLHYTPQKVLGALRHIVEIYKNAFPELQMEMTVPSVALPPIDDKGNIVTAPGSHRINIHTSSTSSMALMEAAQEILGDRLSVSDHALTGFRQAGNLFAYSDFGPHGGYSVGYGNAWLASNDTKCYTTGGYKWGNPPECVGAWAMAEDINEALISGASYMVLDAEDLLDPAYGPVLKIGHDFLLRQAEGRGRLLMRDQQSLNASNARMHAVRVVAPPLAIAPPMSLSRDKGPPLQYMQEDDTGRADGEHGVSLGFSLTPKQTYSFSIFVSKPNDTNRLVRIDANENSNHEVYGVFGINDRVLDSSPVQVGAKGVGGPGAAQINCIPSNENWCQLTIQFTAAEVDNTISIRFVRADRSVANTDDQGLAYPGDPRAGMSFWGMQIEPLISSQTSQPD